MKQLAIGLFVLAFTATGALAQSCANKAVGADGKPLAGAAKTSFVEKCKKDTKAACETKAIGTDGKKLAGAAKKSFMKSCRKAA